LLIDKTLSRIDQTNGRNMNIHHLELFFHVAKHGGISRAVRQMPYGIQQSAVSAQILRLEQDLEVMLFHRRPFRLTPSGEMLFKFVSPFFSRLDEVAAQIRGDTSQRLRLAASGIVLREHFPKILQAHRRKFPDLRFTLREANQADAERMLQEDEIDLAITEVEGKTAAGITSSVLLALPLAFVVSQESKFGSAAELLRRDDLTASLITLPLAETITRLFQKGLKNIGAELVPLIEVSSLELMKSYVAAGFGIGLAVAGPQENIHSAVRMLPIDGFPKLVVGAMWRRKLAPVVQSFFDAIKQHSGVMMASMRSGQVNPRRQRK
jgi:DNA-binding transcriptional LysR family regulator